MKSNKKTMKKMRIKLNKNTYKKNNRTKHKKQHGGGNTTNTINTTTARPDWLAGSLSSRCPP